MTTNVSGFGAQERPPSGQIAVRFRGDPRGCMIGDLQVSSRDDAPLINEAVREIKGQFGEDADVSLQVWAGPFEVMLAVGAALGGLGTAAAGFGGAARGVADLLTALKRRKPSYVMTVDLEDGRTVTITGEELPPDVKALIDRRFAEHSDPAALIGQPIDGEVESGESQ